MANVSSFFGYLSFNYYGGPSWTAEGYLLVYDILMAIDASGGSYGVCLAEEYTEDSAVFLEHLLSQTEPATISFWGNGRWSATSTFERFNNWTKGPSREQKMSEETYKRNRERLLKLMYENEWFLEFEYIDEESGVGFLYEATTTIFVKKDDTTDEYYFSSDDDIISDHDYNLQAYSLLIEEYQTGEAFKYVMGSLYNVLQIPEYLQETFDKFIIDNDYDTLLYPNYYYDSVEYVPEEIIEGWKERLKQEGA